MASKEFHSALLRFLRNILLIDLVVFALVGAICWGTGRRSAQHCGTGLMLPGAFLLDIGGYSFSGNVSAARSVGY